MCNRPFTSTPAFARVSISATSAAGSTTTPVPLRPQNSAGDELQHEAVFSDDDGVPRVVASGNACNVVERAGQIVYDLALALITPLRAYHHNGFHSFSLFSRFPGSPGTTALTRPHPSLSAMP